MFRREFHIASGKHIGGIDVIPVVEVWVAAGTMPALHSFVGGARPIGFAIITPAGGYWLVSPQDLLDLAHAVNMCIETEVKAS